MARRKLRSALALFGIMWGTISVVLLLSIGQGFYLTNKKDLEELLSKISIYNSFSSLIVFPS